MLKNLKLSPVHLLSCFSLHLCLCVPWPSFNWQTWQGWVYVWWLWGQGAALAWVERTQPLIITDSKQLVLQGLFSSSKIGTERSLWIMQELQRGRKSVAMDHRCFFCCWWWKPVAKRQRRIFIDPRVPPPTHADTLGCAHFYALHHKSQPSLNCVCFAHFDSLKRCLPVLPCFLSICPPLCLTPLCLKWIPAASHSWLGSVSPLSASLFSLYFILFIAYPSILPCTCAHTFYHDFT